MKDKGKKVRSHVAMVFPRNEPELDPFTEDTIFPDPFTEDPILPITISVEVDSSRATEIEARILAIPGVVGGRA